MSASQPRQPAPAPVTQRAELVIRGSRLEPSCSSNPEATAVAIAGGRILWLGSDHDADHWIDRDTVLIEARGQTVMPGFHDSHAHPMMAGTRSARCQLDHVGSVEELFRMIEAHESSLAPGQWLRGEGLPSQLASAAFDYRSRLDRTFPRRGVFLSNQRGDLAVANTVAFEAAGVGSTTPDPPGGSYARDEDGEPSGLIRGNAITAIWSVIPAPGEPELRNALRQASAIANRYGITSMHDASVREPQWRAYCAADTAGEMTLRVQSSLRWDWQGDRSQLEELARRRLIAARGSRYRADFIKLFVDGDLAGQTAWLLDPYVGSSQCGSSNFDERELGDLAQAIDARGIDVHFHTFGDRAVRAALDAIEHTRRIHGPRDRRPQLAHVNLIAPADLERFADLDVTASIQPAWAYRSEIVEEEVERVGPERARRMLAFRSLRDAGARLAAGSDWPSAPLNPLVGMAVGMSRRRAADRSALNSEESLRRCDLVAAYTRTAAWLMRQEDETGELAPGKAADIIVLDGEIDRCPAEELENIEIEATIVGGEIVYRRDDSSSVV